MTAIRTRGLTKRYGRTVAVRDLDLSVDEGEVFGFLGENGAGKSTTIDLLLNFVRPTSGTADVLGCDAHAEPMEVRERVGVVPEGYSPYNRLTGREHLQFALDSKRSQGDAEALRERVGLDASAMDRRVGGYSKGMTQRLVLGMALAGDPELLVLDEPASGLDPNGIRMLRRLLDSERSEGTTVFLSSHILEHVDAVCDRVAIMRGGELVAEDSADGLRETVGVTSTLVVETAGSPDSVPLEVEGVTDVTTRSDGVAVAFTSSQAKLRVLDRLRDASVTIEDFRVEETPLDAVFSSYVDAPEEEETP